MAFINCTLIVQIINFFIAFFIIKYFFFKPVVEHIQAEDALQESLLNTVQANRVIVAQKEQELLAHWQSAYHYFKKNTPSLVHEPFFSAKSSIVKPHFEPTMINDMVKQATTQLVKGIDHVR